MKKLILFIALLIIGCSVEANVSQTGPSYGKVAHFIDHVTYKSHMNKRHKKFKEQHRKNVKRQNKMHKTR